jgi:hypothetical protein
MDNVPPGEVRQSAGSADNPQSATTLNLSAPRTAVLQPEIDEQTRRSQSGANWFFWIAALSLVNSVIVVMEGNWSFLAGLGVTQFIDGLAQGLSIRLGAAATVFALILDVAAAGVLVMFGLLARQRYSWAFVLGMILYALDGLLFVILRDWLGLAFHAYALFCIYRGFRANNALRELLTEVDGVG